MANFLLINFGTFVETHRFKALSAAGNFAETDALDSTKPGPGALVQDSGVQQRPFVGGARVYSFYGLSKTVWQSNMNGKTFREEFKKWVENALANPIHCVYMTGHHWDGGSVYTTLSWGNETKYFHARFDTDKGKLAFGVEGDRVDIETKNLRAECKLVFGFGCNVCTGGNSTKYQNFFTPSKPVMCGWTESIGVPKSEVKSVNKRFFDYIDKYIAKEANVAKTDRVIWIYDNDSMELVKAWGWATKYWFQKQARARDKHGKFYKFKVNSKGWPEPVKA